MDMAEQPPTDAEIEIEARKHHHLRLILTGHQIRARRRALGLTQVQVAEATDTFQPTISMIENGKIRYLGESLQRRLETALDVPEGTFNPHPASKTGPPTEAQKGGE